MNDDVEPDVQVPEQADPRQGDEKPRWNLAREPNGYFAVGNSGGPGRPRKIDFRKLCEEKAKAEGVNLKDTVWSVFMKQRALALQGDPAAARLVLTLLVDQDDVAVAAQAGLMVRVITGLSE